MLQAEPGKINGQVFNVGSDANNYQLKPLAETVADTVKRDVALEWYGDPDHRSYRVSFDKIEDLGYKATHNAKDGVMEIAEALQSGKLDKTTETLTLNWYQELVKWHKIIKEVEMYGGIIDI